MNLHHEAGARSLPGFEPPLDVEVVLIRLLLVGLMLLSAGTVQAAAARGSRATKPAAAASRQWGPAGVDWSAGVLRATGAGAPDYKAANASQARLGAERAANADALRRLTRQVRALPLRAGKTAGEVMAKEAGLAEEVEKVLQGYRITDKRYYSDGGLEIDVEVPLGALASKLLASDAPDKGTSGTSGAATNSGLVVDARHLKLRPVLSPRLVDPKGQPLFDAGSVRRQSLESDGVVGYASSLSEATGSLRVGAKPLVAKATRVKGSDIFLDASTARKLREGNAAFFSEGRVVLVLK